MGTLLTNIDAQTKRLIESVDFDQMNWTYHDQNEFIVQERFFPKGILDELLCEVDRVREQVNRNYIPFHKKGGSVSFYDLRKDASVILALYQSPAMLGLVSRLAKTELMLCPEDDPHSCALYFYTEPGDHIGWHYDTSYYHGARYTVLVGLVEKSRQCRLVAQLYKDIPNRETQDVQIPLDSGSIAIFNGDKLWHAVTPLGEGEERVILTLQYVTNQNMGSVKRAFSNLKDAFAYFGPAAILRRKAPQL
jgi:alkylated DNA repair dioxygenase AlkB